MARHQRSRWKHGAAWIRAAQAVLQRTARRLWRLRRRWRGCVPIEVLVADQSERRTMESELRTGLAQLQRVLGSPLPDGLAVVVQQVMPTDGRLAGWYQVGQFPDGSRFTLVRLALQVGERRLSVNELLAALAEQCIELVTEQPGAASVLVPVDVVLARSDATRLAATLRPDPLAGRRNGAAPIEHRADSHTTPSDDWEH